MTRYRIVVVCAGYRYTLYTVHGGGRRGGRGAGSPISTYRHPSSCLGLNGGKEGGGGEPC
jgi:hypothetical protein